MSNLNGECENDVNLGQNRFDVFRHVNFRHTRVLVVHRSTTQTHLVMRLADNNFNVSVAIRLPPHLKHKDV